MYPQVLAQETQTLTETKTELMVGRPLKRKEDGRFLTGTSRFVDDIKLPGMLHCAVLRSPHAHARIKTIDISKAMNAHGVRLVLIARDIPKQSSILNTIANEDGTRIERPVLAADEVCYVGEAIAFVAADSRQDSEDALELIEVDYETLPAAIDPAEAMKNDAAKSHLSLKANTVMRDKVESGDVASAFSKAFKVVKVDLLNQRLAPSPMEPRAILASYDQGIQNLNVWMSTQGPFQNRSELSGYLDIPENKIRVFAPDVGGGFGAKLSSYPEDILVCIAAMRTMRPTKWVESRSENLMVMTQGRGQLQHVEMAVNEKGRILGLKVSLIGDAGAYLTEGSSDATFTLRMAPGQYAIPAYLGEAAIVLTNKVPHEAYRGASRPEATYLIERTMDEMARELGADPVEVRLRNFVPKEDFPFKTITELEYDTGDYSMNLKRALEYSGYDKWIKERLAEKSPKKLIGVGLATYVEICSFGPDYPQTAAISVSEQGRITVISGTSPHGQGHETPLAQIVADKLGVSVADVTVTYGDTALLAWGTFTAGSRSAALGGAAVYLCAEKIKDKMGKIAAKSLDVREDDLVFEEGKIMPKNNRDPKKVLTFGKVASYAYRPKKLPDGMEPVLYAFSAFAPPNFTYPFGTHVAVVEVDVETGVPTLLDYTAVDDCGNVLNPMIVDGQIHGGAAQGLGQAMLEDVVYSEDGQLLSSSFLDYQIPMAEDIPQVHTYRTVTPTYANPMGLKGIGEAATIAATPVIMNAVRDALAKIGVKVEKMPAKPDYLFSLIHSVGHHKLMLT
jgi:aerobic carbon-monoxide dehydrogenase large subunit